MSEPEDRSYIPYYYGLNYEAPPGVGNQGAFPFRGLGLLAGRAMRQGVVGGADAGLWLERLAGVPLEPERMMIDWGDESKPDTPSDWTSYHTAPEAAGMFAGEQFKRFIEPVGRVGDVLRGKNPYGAVDEINLPSTVREAMIRDVFEAAGVAAVPGMFGSRVGATTVGGLGGREALLAKRQGLIDKVKGIKGDYDRMVAESAKITGLAPKGKDTLFLWEPLNEAQLAKINQTSARLLQDAGVDLSNIRSVRPKDPKSSALLDLYIQTSKEFGSEMTGEEFYRQIKYAFGNDKDTLRFLDAAGFTDIKAESAREYIRKPFNQKIEGGESQISTDLIGRIQNKFKSAYAAAREVAGGGSWVDIAVLRDNLGLSQEKMAGLLRRAAREGHVVLEKGERSVVSDYLKGGMVDNKLLVRLDPEFFDNIGNYIKQDVRKSISQMEVDEIEKELLR